MIKRSRKTGQLLDVSIGSGNLERLVSEALDAIDRKIPQIVFACANTHSLVVAKEDREFLRALSNAEQTVADGVGITIMGDLFNIDVGPRIAGEQYFKALMGALNARGGARVFFFGSSQEVLDQISTQMSLSYPALELCGSISPPFRPWSSDENKQFVEAINAARVDVLWVGMTAPKQEKWVHQNRAVLNVPVIGSVGAVFDFFAQTVPSPPRWVRKLGLESPYHLVKNPKRTWKRIFVSVPKYVFHVIRSQLTTTRKH
jgi:N-acetylglucosaminyldiphosphoundecaprenol N-acetyl-beta-D-mannosaminyltransferase